MKYFLIKKIILGKILYWNTTQDVFSLQQHVLGGCFELKTQISSFNLCAQITKD
jgi:hypothetical protein